MYDSSGQNRDLLMKQPGADFRDLSRDMQTPHTFV